MVIRRDAKYITHLKCRGFLPFNAKWINRINDLKQLLCSNFLHYIQRNIKVVFNLKDIRSMNDRLSKFSYCDFPFWNHNAHRKPSTSPIGCSRSRGISRGRANHSSYLLLDCLRHR